MPWRIDASVAANQDPDPQPCIAADPDPCVAADQDSDPKPCSLADPKPWTVTLAVRLHDKARIGMVYDRGQQR